MRTISNSEFAAHPEMYLDMAQEQDVMIRRGQKVFHLTCEEEFPPQAARQPDDDLRSAITGEELKKRMRGSIHQFFADKR